MNTADEKACVQQPAANVHRRVGAFPVRLHSRAAAERRGHNDGDGQYSPPWIPLYVLLYAAFPGCGLLTSNACDDGAGRA